VQVVDWVCEIRNLRAEFISCLFKIGVGVLLSILLRTEYPDIECFSYSPPGGLLR